MDDGRYVKRTCVRVSHQPVSQCVDVTLMQMACAGIHLGKENNKHRLLLKEAELSLLAFSPFILESLYLPCSKAPLKFLLEDESAHFPAGIQTSKVHQLLPVAGN